MKKEASPEVVFLKGKKITLRPLSEKDIPLLLKWVNNPEIRVFISRNLPATEDAERDWLSGLNKSQDRNVVLIIELKGKPIGTIGLHDIRWVSRTADVGIQIGETDLHEKGYGTDAAMTLFNYAFNTLNLRKLMWHALVFNKRSIACMQRCGGKIEATLKEQLFRDGKHHDEVILGLFKHQWLPIWESYCKK